MTIEVLQKDMIAAMKAHDKARKEVISSMVSAVKKMAIDEGTRENIPEELVGRALTKELRTAKEMIDTCPASRQDLLEQYQYNYSVIEEYAPKMMSEDEIRAFLNENCADVLAGKNKGMIMKTVMPLLKGRADGKTIQKIVGELCK